MRVAIHIAMHRQEVAERAPKSAFTMLKPGWWEARELIFRKHCLASLEAQTNRDFVVLMTVRDQDDIPENPLLRTAREAGIFVVSRPYLPCRYPLAPNYYNAVSDLWHGEEGLMLISLDSDDCLHRKAIEEVHAVKPQDGLTIYWDIGYAYSPVDGRLVEYGVPDFPGPFYGRYYTAEALQSTEAFTRYQEQWGFQIFHYQAGHRKPSLRMPRGRVVQTMHDANSTSGWRDPHVKKRIIRDVPCGERAAILERFGVAL